MGLAALHVAGWGVLAVPFFCMCLIVFVCFVLGDLHDIKLERDDVMLLTLNSRSFWEPVHRLHEP